MMQPTDDRNFTVRKILYADVQGRRRRIHLPHVRTFDSPELDYEVSVEVDLLEDDGRVVCTSLTVTRRPDGHPVQAQRLRVLPFRRLVALAVADATYAADDERWAWGVPDEEGEAVLGATERKRGPGSPPVPEEHLRQAWDIYVESRKRPDKRDHIAFTQGQLKKRHNIHKGRSTVHSWIQKAKEAGFDGER